MNKRIHLIKKSTYLVITVLVMIGCQNIDLPEFGEFEIDPSVVQIISPVEGSAIKVFEDLTSIDIEIEVHDDNLVSEISIALDGTELVKYNDFTNPRRISKIYTHSGLANGDYTLTVTSTDINGKSTSAEAKFSKESPYDALFEGEALYMPFDGDYRDLIGFVEADEVGSPGFAGSGFAGSNAYKGATDAYLTFPSEGLLSNEFSAAFWYKVSGTPDRAGLLVIGDNADDRNQGFRLFREGSATEQTIKLNVGTGAGESWNDGGVIDVAAGEWVHIAFTISQTESKVYFNGNEMNTGALDGPIDWTGVGPLTIGSGGDTFSYWDHKSDSSDMDELRIFNKALSQADIQIMINAFNPYIPQFAGESFYMPFDNGFINLVGNIAATQVGSPQIETNDTHDGSGAYLGAVDSYLTYPAEGLLANQFSTTFWYKVNSSPDRSGILVIGDDTPENRNQGFRLFREGDGTEQRIKFNVGTGGAESWNDGGVIDVTAGEWVQIAVTISDTQTKIYFNGVEMNSADLAAPIDWTGCDSFSIASGAPTFSYWDHGWDGSVIDELRFFDKALSSEEVAAVYGGDVILPFFGASLYMPFDADVINKANNVASTVVGTTGFSGEGKVGANSFLGSADSYLTHPTTDITTSDTFSGAMWYKLDASPDRAGILTIGPEDTGNGGFPDTQNLRTSGFRFFRENGEPGFQRFKLNVGNGTADAWIDGGVAADVATDAGWIHLAFTISATEAKVYVNGTVVGVNNADITGIDWTGCDLLSIMSGAPRFTEWDHHSDLSYLDELYLFNRELTQTEIQTIMAQ